MRRPAGAPRELYNGEATGPTGIARLTEGIDPLTYWNGQECRARRVRVVVGDSGTFPRYWARLEGLVGQVIDAVRVDYHRRPFYLDNRDGSAWRKVTEGHGSPHIGHRDVEIDHEVADA